jgi:hypothetical protein
MRVADRNVFLWRSMIRQPNYVNESVLELAKASLFQFHEGLCVQCMHIGPFDAEPATIKAMTQLALDQGYMQDLFKTRCHHEVYLRDPRRMAPEKMKTVIRNPIRKA